jgi:hypothetical protein
VAVRLLFMIVVRRHHSPAKTVTAPLNQAHPVLTSGACV